MGLVLTRRTYSIYQTLNPATREIFLDVVDVQELPRNVYYGDGSEIEESILAEICGVLDEETIYFP